MFGLHINAAQWRGHLAAVVERHPDIVPVAKGNGYGFGLAMLAAESQALGCPTIAVGALDEVALVHDAFRGDVLVLTPWHPAIDHEPHADDRRILTVSSLEAVHALTGQRHRTVVELLTSMARFGLDEDALSRAVPELRELALEGFALHLPIDDGELGRVDEISSWVSTLRRHQLPTDTLWVSHVSDAELGTLHRRHPETTFRPRIGTALWLGERQSYQAKGTVLADTSRQTRAALRLPPTQGERRRHTCWSSVAEHPTASPLSAPRSVRGVTARLKLAGEGTLEAGGRALSPFYVAGKRRWFAEPPHMQVSMIWLPSGVAPPVVGADVPVDVRMTTATFDEVILH